jgi:hypothetical protein
MATDPTTPQQTATSTPGDAPKKGIAEELREKVGREPYLHEIMEHPEAHRIKFLGMEFRGKQIWSMDEPLVHGEELDRRLREAGAYGDEEPNPSDTRSPDSSPTSKASQ